MAKIVFLDYNIDQAGGVEMVISELANRMCGRNEVTVISRMRTKEEPFFRYDEKVKKIYQIDERKNRTNAFKEKNLSYYALRFGWKIKEKIAKYNPSANIMKEIKNADVIVFARIPVFLDFRKKLKAVKKNQKIIVRDALHYYSLSDKQRTAFIESLNNSIDYFVVSSEELKAKYIQSLGRKHKVKIVKIYNPCRAKKNSAKKQNYITWIGRISEEKGVKYLVEAFSRIEQNYDWELRIYGDGTASEEVRKIIKDRKIENRVKMIGFTSDVDKTLEESKIFVLPSRTEGYANALVEAMFHGCACITFDWLMGASEIINDGINGKIVHLKDAKEYHDTGKLHASDVRNISETIEELMRNEKEIEKLSKEARKIKDTREGDKIISEWEKLVKS